MNDDMQNFGKAGVEKVLASMGAWSKGGQAMMAEMVDYTRKSAASSAAAWEKLLEAKTLEKAIELQGEYVRSSYREFVAEATKVGELCVDTAKEAFKPFEVAFAKSASAI